MRAIRSLLIVVGSSAPWPAYLGLLAYAARQGPWPRSIAVPASVTLLILALVVLVASLARWMLRRDGWAEATLQVPAEVTRQLRRAVLALAIPGMLLLWPESLLSWGLIAPGGRPVSASALCRLLCLGFELTAWGVAYCLLRGRSPLVQWLLQFPENLGWWNRHRLLVRWTVLVAIASVVVLDVLGYSFTARRLATGAVQTSALTCSCWVLYRLILRAIDRHAWRWVRSGRSLAGDESPDVSGPPDDLAARLRRLTVYLVPALGLILGAWIWDVDLALFRSLGEEQLWRVDPKSDVFVTVGDLTKALLVIVLCAAAWRHMSTFFAVVVFPRMRDDPGVRFAVMTLARYAVLGLGLLIGLSAIHLGPEKIGVVLAALGVGLGFGLQEIVSNFVCGIILLLERPIRVGDVVTVSGMSGKVERINIRATTITNPDNQSMIIPNRAFITSDLINWTLKDKVIRVSIRVKVAHGTDPDRVSELLLALAREDADVLRNPVPVSFMEEFSDSALNFVLFVHVPEPSLGGRVRHRLFARIQRRFAECGIAIPLPTQELLVKPHGGPAFSSLGDLIRTDSASPTPPTPRSLSTHPSIPSAVEDCHRGVDE